MAAEPVYFEAKNIAKSFGGLQAVSDLSFAIRQGQVSAIIGPNGAGKTTTFNLISSFLKPDAGELWYRGRNITNLPPHQIVKLGIARTFQDLRLFYKLTVLENALLGIQGRRGESVWRSLVAGPGLAAENRRHTAKALELLEFVGLADRANEIAENLSYGEQKMVALARLLATDADLLLLDEPASGLPEQTVAQMLGLIRRLATGGKTVLLVDHNMEAVMGVADFILVLDFGRRIASGTPSEVQQNEEVVRVYLGV